MFSINCNSDSKWKECITEVAVNCAHVRCHTRDYVDSLMLTGNPTEKETEQITQLWQGSLFNAHYDVQRYHTEYCLMWSPLFVVTCSHHRQDSFVLSRPSFHEFCLVRVGGLNTIGDETKPSCLVHIGGVNTIGDETKMSGLVCSCVHSAETDKTRQFCLVSNCSHHQRGQDKTCPDL